MEDLPVMVSLKEKKDTKAKSGITGKRRTTTYNMHAVTYYYNGTPTM